MYFLLHAESIRIVMSIPLIENFYGQWLGLSVQSCSHSWSLLNRSADALFFIRRGKIKLSVISQQGKEAIVAILNEGEFFGEGCLAGQTVRMASAIAITDCTLDKIEKPLMERILHEHQDISELFVKHLLSRNHYLSAAIFYLFQHRPGWCKGVAVGKTLVSSRMIDCVAVKLCLWPARRRTARCA
jgi:hypothetical protein